MADRRLPEPAVDLIIFATAVATTVGIDLLVQRAEASGFSFPLEAALWGVVLGGILALLRRRVDAHPERDAA